MVHTSAIDRKKLLAVVVAAALVALECALLFGAFSKSRSTGRVIETDIANPIDFERALENDRLILHLDVSWSIQAVRSRATIENFKEAIECDDRLRGIPFRRIDCSNQSGELWDAVTSWFSKQAEGRDFMTAGYGAVVWVEAGVVVQGVHDAAETGVEDLIEITRNTYVDGPNRR